MDKEDLQQHIITYLDEWNESQDSRDRNVATAFVLSFLRHIDSFDIKNVDPNQLQRAKRIKNFRVNAGLTQTDAAEALGITQSKFSRIERGVVYKLTQEKTDKILKVLNDTFR